MKTTIKLTLTQVDTLFPILPNIFTVRPAKVVDLIDDLAKQHKINQKQSNKFRDEYIKIEEKKQGVIKAKEKILEI